MFPTMKYARHLLFWTFVTTFFLISTTTIFYAFGYRFNFTRGIFIYTGAISVKANPENVDIRIDDEMIPQQKLGILNKAILIAGLTPGEHRIEVSAPGYFPWDKKVIVQSGLSAEFWNVLLTKTNPAPEILTGIDRVRKIFPAPDENLYAVAQQENTTLTISIFDTQSNEKTMSFFLDNATFPKESENIEWSPDNRKLIIPLEQNGLPTYAIANLKDQKITYLQSPVEKIVSLSHPRWDSTTRNLLFYWKNKSLYRADSEQVTKTPLLIKAGIVAYDISKDNLYYLYENGIIYRVPANRNDVEPTQVTVNALDIAPQNPYSLVVYDDNRIAIRDLTTGALWVHNKYSSSQAIPKLLMKQGSKGVQFSNDGKKLLFFGDHDISVYFTVAWAPQPSRNADTTLQIIRLASDIKNVQWTQSYEHILFTAGTRASIVELDHRDHRNITPLISFHDSIIQVISRFQKNLTYFVLENGQVQVITFPAVQTNLFGF
ncbi:MAG: hypothetical protein ACSLEX_04125 [Minisyncoccota bacterium]